jgi:hypothetical protein
MSKKKFYLVTLMTTIAYNNIYLDKIDGGWIFFKLMDCGDNKFYKSAIKAAQEALKYYEYK